MANYISYADKVGLIAKTTHVNQWWDDDANEVKIKHNLNDDRITVVENYLNGNIDPADFVSFDTLAENVSPTSGDLVLVEILATGAKTKMSLSSFISAVNDHSALSNLDYASSGHTGFQSTLTHSSGVQEVGGAVTVVPAEIDHDTLANVDGDRHFLMSEIEITSSQITDLSSEIPIPIQEMTLPAATDVAGRISGATLPAGWSIAASGTDLVVTHNLSRRVKDVKIWVVTGTEEQQLRNIASDNGLVTPDANTLKIVSLGTINKVLKVYIEFV